MKYSIETRLPFMDHRIVELGLTFPSSEIFKNGYTKFPIRKIMENKIPNSVLYSQKRDIQNPQTSWLMNKPIFDFIYDCVSSKSFKERGFYNQSKSKNLLVKFRNKGAENSFFILQWLNVEIWHQQFQDNLNENIFNLLNRKKIHIKIVKNENFSK